jgi:hypothetical protein
VVTPPEELAPDEGALPEELPLLELAAVWSLALSPPEGALGP